MLDLIIIGAGGFGRELYEMLPAVYSSSEYRFAGFLAQDDGQLSNYGVDAKVIADPEAYEPRESDRFLLAIGYMEARRRIVASLEERGGIVESFIHPKAHIASTAKIDRGAVIYPFAVVSNNAFLEPHVHLNYYASVGHDCHVGEYCLLAPYATLNGFVNLGPDGYVSTHATVVPGRNLGRGSKISANSACMHDTPPNTFVFGVPGRQVTRMD